MSTLLPTGPEAISRAAEALAAGELVAFPTETVYGLGADARNEAAVAEVFRLKGRPGSHPLIVHLPAAAELWHWADRDEQAATGVEPATIERLAAELWPGPVTFVLSALPRVSRLVTGGQDTVALRVPGHPTALALLSEFGGAVVAPSANRFGYVSPTTAEHVASEFPGDLLVLDAGATRFGLESTIVDLSTQRPRLLRPGSLDIERIEQVLGSKLLRSEPQAGSAAASQQGVAAGVGVPRVPGSLASHYSPRAALRVLAEEEFRSALAGAAGPSTGFLLRGAGAGSGEERVVSLPADAVGFAAGLYAALRSLDAAGVDEILVARPPDSDDWLAVRDRLGRAASRAAAETGRPTPQVAVVMGSTSDWETMRHATELLERFAVAHTCQVVSAHRTPEKMATFAAGAAAAGYRVIIAGAGGAAHLPGMVAAQTHLPVLGVPVQSSALNGVDSLLSQVQMPRGVPVGTLAIGPAGALNAALLAIAILALSDERLERELIAYREAQTAAALGSELPSPNFRR